MTHGVDMHIEEFNKRFLNPWDRGEQRKTPCCNGQSWLLDNTQTGGPGGSRWECDKCHRVWCWSSMIPVSNPSDDTV